MRLPSWFELSHLRISSTAVFIRSGFSISRFFCVGLSDNATSPLPIRLVVVSCPALSRKMQFCSNSALGVQMLHHARNKYPWFEMQTLYPFDKTGVRTAVADAMAMRTVKSTIVPFPHLLEA